MQSTVSGEDKQFGNKLKSDLQFTDEETTIPRYKGTFSKLPVMTEPGY